MFDYTRREIHTTTNNSSKNINQNISKIIPICQMQDIRTAPKHFAASLSILQKKDTAEYYNNMEKAFVWLPGNLVIGPRQRGANPGNEYDREAAHIAGIPLGTPRYLGPMVAEPTGQMALGEALSMMLYYIDGTIDRLNQNIIDTILIPHIKRAIFNGIEAGWR